MTHSDIWNAIELFAANRGMSCSALAKNSGLDATTFNKSKRYSREGQERWPNTQSLAKILSSTGANIMDLARFMPQGADDQSHPVITD